MKSRFALVLTLAVSSAAMLCGPARAADQEPAPKYPPGILRLDSLPAIPQQRVGWAAGQIGDTLVLAGGVSRRSVAGGLKADEASSSALVLTKG
ncbi:MAG: hypothetical protein ABR915_15350, partial [Thermoguttaceae bacterium]